MVGSFAACSARAVLGPITAATPRSPRSWILAGLRVAKAQGGCLDRGCAGPSRSRSPRIWKHSFFARQPPCSNRVSRTLVPTRFHDLAFIAEASQSRAGAARDVRDQGAHEERGGPPRWLICNAKTTLTASNSTRPAFPYPLSNGLDDAVRMVGLLQGKPQPFLHPRIRTRWWLNERRDLDDWGEKIPLVNAVSGRSFGTHRLARAP